MPPAEAARRLRSARNLWAADPGMSREERDRLVRELAVALWGPDARVPEETDLDREAQEQIRIASQELKRRAVALQNDPDLGREDKESELNQLIDAFLRTVEPQEK